MVCLCLNVHVYIHRRPAASLLIYIGAMRPVEVSVPSVGACVRPVGCTACRGCIGLVWPCVRVLVLYRGGACRPSMVQPAGAVWRSPCAWCPAGRCVSAVVLDRVQRRRLLRAAVVLCRAAGGVSCVRRRVRCQSDRGRCVVRLAASPAALRAAAGADPAGLVPLPWWFVLFLVLFCTMSSCFALHGV